MNIEAMIAAAKAKRDPRCTDRNGNTWRTPEKAEFINDMLDWHAAGKPAEQMPALKAREAALRAADLY